MPQIILGGRYNLYNLEFLLGYSRRYDILNSLYANISLQGGIKKGNAYDQRLITTNIKDPLYVLFEVDRFDKVLSHNYYLLELPINFGYKIIKSVDLTVGFSFRYYFPQKNQEQYNYIFNNRFENRITNGLSIRLSKNLFIDGNFIFAVKESYSKLFASIDQEYRSTLKARAIQIKLQYSFH